MPWACSCWQRLCVLQWQVNRRANLRIVALEKTREELVQKIADQDRTLQGNRADLDDFRRRLENSAAAFLEAERKAAVVGAERDLATAVCNQAQVDLESVQEALAKWIDTAHQREEA